MHLYISKYVSQIALGQSKDTISLVLTARRKSSRTICILCSVLWVLWPNRNNLKSNAIILGFWLQIDIDWIFKWLFISQTPSSKSSKTVDPWSWRSKKIQSFWVRGYVFCNFAMISLVFRRSGFDSRPLQTLKAHNFAVFWRTGSKTSFFERSDLCLLG